MPERPRNKIDAVDDKILELLNERMTYVKKYRRDQANKWWSDLSS